MAIQRTWLVFGPIEQKNEEQSSFKCDTYDSLDDLYGVNFGAGVSNNVMFDLSKPTTTITKDMGNNTQYFNFGSNKRSGDIIVLITYIKK